jgi:TPR repeat protein/uncharacterized caspase-like protein
MRRWLSVLALLFVGFGGVNPALADKRVALIVANGDYVGAPLENPTTDADLVAASLGNIGFAVKVLKNLDLVAFDGAVNAFADTAKGADVALFYFAGHGFTVNDGIKPVSVLMSTSANVTASSDRVLRAGGLPLDDIAMSLAAQAKVTLVFVDACRNDPRIVRAIGGKGRGFAVLDPVQGGSLFIGLSTRLGGTARDGVGGKGSPFARAFAQNVQTKGVRIDDMFRQVRDTVKAETESAQLPDVVQDDLPNGAITLVEVPATPATSVASLETGRVASDEAMKALVAECDRLAASPYDARRPAGVAGVEEEVIDAGRAVPACRAAIAVSPNDPRLELQLGLALTKAGGADAEVLTLFQKAADAGYTPAVTDLGMMYVRGKGVSKDAAAAVSWFRKAADAGYAPAMTDLGRMYQRGDGVSKDAAAAMSWFRKAADAGYAPGLYQMGLVYQLGWGVPKDASEAARWYRKAADAGEESGMAVLGVMYKKGDGVPKDEAEAESWFRKAEKLIRKAAEAGSASSMGRLGQLYDHGLGVPEDAAEAARWYRKAADAGDLWGAVRLGQFYESGTGVPTDASEAVRWYRKAAEAGSASSMSRLGQLYENGAGTGVPKDAAQALSWYQKAADAGDPGGKAALERLASQRKNSN